MASIPIHRSSLGIALCCLAVACASVPQHAAAANLANAVFLLGMPPVADTTELQPVTGPLADTVQQNALPSGLRELTAEQLAKVGIRYDTASISYIEEGIRFHVRTTGINITGSNGASDGRTPRHITLYKQGVNVASWKRTEPNDEVDQLVGIRVRLHDPSAAPEHRDAVVVVWVIPPDDGSIPPSVASSDNTSLDTTPTTEQRPAPTIVRTSVRPNPVSGSTATLTIDVTAPGHATVAIYDMLGAKTQTVAENTPLYAGQQDLVLYNMHELPQGMYLVVVDVHETRERQARRMLIER